MSAAEVAEMVDRALTSMSTWVDDGAFTPLNVRNVIVNHKIGPDLPYGRVLYALSRNPRVRRLKRGHPGDRLLPRDMRQPRYYLADFKADR